MSDITTIKVNNVEYSIKDATARSTIASLVTWKNTLLNAIFPVGSVYLTITNTNPGTFLGGTWSLTHKGKAIIGVNPNDSRFSTSGKTIGSPNTVLPSHTHTQAQHNHVVDSHSHGAGSLSGYYKCREADNNKSGAAGAIRYTYSGFNVNSSSGSVVISGNTAASAPSTNYAQPTISTVGTDATDKNYQPSETLYIWKRTA